jgi:hypothetical protein
MSLNRERRRQPAVDVGINFGDEIQADAETAVRRRHLTKVTGWANQRACVAVHVQGTPALLCCVEPSGRTVRGTTTGTST